MHLATTLHTRRTSSVPTLVGGCRDFDGPSFFQAGGCQGLSTSPRAPHFPNPADASTDMERPHYTCVAPAHIDRLPLEIMRQHVLPRLEPKDLVNFAACSRCARWDVNAAANAAKDGNLWIYRLLRDNCGRMDDNAARYAALHGQHEALKWMWKNGSIGDWTDEVAAYAARGGHVHVLDALETMYLRYDGLLYTTPCCNKLAMEASKCGHLQVLVWLLDREPAFLHEPDLPEVSAFAAQHHHFNILEWLLDNDCRLCKATMNYTVQNGTLDMVKRLRAHQCPWDVTAVDTAVQYGRHDVLQWLLDNGCPSVTGAIEVTGATPGDLVEFDYDPYRKFY